MMQRKLGGARHTLPVLVILLLCITWFHARGLRPGYTFVPVDLANNHLPWLQGPARALQNPLITDPVYEFYPFVSNAVDTLRHERIWPLWNPNFFLGQPIFADPLNQTFYPVFWLLGLAFGAARGLALGLWLHALLAAGLTYGLLRAIGCGRRASLLGALVYALSGYMVTWFETPFWVSTLSWLPGIVWMFELAVRRRSWGFTAVAALMLGLTMLAGQYEFVLAFSLFLALYAAGRSLESLRSGWRTALWPFIVLSVVFALGALLGAIQLVPSAEFLQLSQRTISEGLRDPFPANQLVTLVVPNLFGNPANGGSYWGAVDFAECTIYAGGTALLLGCAAPLVARQFFVRYLSVIGLITLCFAVGGPGVSLLSHVPVIRYASLHRSVFLVPLLVAMLAAFALDAPEMRGRVVAIVCLVVGVFGAIAIWQNLGLLNGHWPQVSIAIWHSAGLLALMAAVLCLRGSFPNLRAYSDWLVISLVFADLYVFGSHFNPAGPIAELMPPTPGIKYLQGHAGFQRVVPYQPTDNLLFGPNVLSLYGLEDPGGYSSLGSMRYRQLLMAGDPVIQATWGALGNVALFRYPSSRLLDLLGANYAVSSVPFPESPVVADVAPARCQNDSRGLTLGGAISGTLTVRNVAISRLGVSYRVESGQPVPSAVWVRLWRDTDRKQMILDVRQDTAKLSDKASATYYFAPELDDVGRTCTWEVAPVEATPDTNLALCADASGKPVIAVYGAEYTQVYAGEFYVAQRWSPLPRAYVVYSAAHVPDDAQAISCLLDSWFDVRDTAVTAAQLSLPVQPTLPANAAEIALYRPTQVIVQANAARAGLLVLSDQYYPGWYVEVDGQPAPLLRVNEVMKGSHAAARAS
jgi:hypothetical protein